MKNIIEVGTNLFGEPSEKILKRDPVYNKIEKEKRKEMIEAAVSMGTEMARKLSADGKWKESDTLSEYFEKIGISVKHINKDFRLNEIRYCADIAPRRKEILMYEKSIEIWAKEQGNSLEDARNFILIHEIYHYLVYDKNQFASAAYQVPMVKIGKFSIGKTGIRTLEEIAANAFAEEICKACGLEKNGEDWNCGEAM